MSLPSPTKEPADGARSSTTRRGFPLPTRILLAFAVVIAAFALVTGYGIRQHRETARRMRLLSEGYLPLALAIGESRATQVLFGTLLDRVLDERDPAASRSWLNSARRVRPATLARSREAVDAASRLADEPRDIELLRGARIELIDIGNGYEANDALFDRLFAAQQTGDERRARDALAQLRSLEGGLERRLRRVSAEMQHRMSETAVDVEEEESETVALLAGMALAAFALSLLVAWRSRALLVPLRELHDRVLAVARGDLGPRPVHRSDDEIGAVAVEFDRMVQALAQRDTRLRVAAEDLAKLQRLQEAIVESLRAAVVVVDHDGVVRALNQAAERHLELRRDDVGQPLRGTRPDRAIEGLSPLVARVLDRGEPGSLRAAPVLVDDEPVRVLDVMVVPFRQPGAASDGDSRGALVVADDVTEELRTKERLLRSERLAAIGKMAAHVTHEVRNPLSSIGLNAEMLDEELGSLSDGAGSVTEARTLLGSIQRELDRLTNVTEEYLRVARLPAPRLEREDLATIAADVVSFVAREFEVSGVQLLTEGTETTVYVAVDEAQLRQSLLNLLRNAREACDGVDSPRVVVSIRSDGDDAVVEIRDNGRGVGAADRPRLFELFFTTKETGTGLGLALTQQIVAAHGGRIECDDASGGGTVMRILLPCAPRRGELPVVARDPSALVDPRGGPG